MAIASNWFTWALFSAVFAALTAIFAKIGVENIRTIERRQSARLAFAPQAPTHARLQAARTSSALRDRRLAGAYSLEARKSERRFVTRPSRQARINNDAHAIDGEAGLCD